MGRTFRTRLLIHLLTFTVTFINTIAGEVRRGMSLLDFRGGGAGTRPSVIRHGAVLFAFLGQQTTTTLDVLDLCLR